MTSSNDPAASLAAATLLRGRNSLVRPQESCESALNGSTRPAADLGMGTGGEGSTLECTLCRSASELARTLQFGGAVSAGLGALPLLQARQQFFDSLRTTVFSVSLVVHARKVSLALESEGLSLRPGIQPPTRTEELDAFVADHGDSYVASVRVGGECQGVYTFYAQSREQAKQVEEGFGVGVNLGGLSVGPEFSRTIAEVTRSTGVNTTFRVLVRGIGSPPPLGPENLIAFASGFASLPLDRPELLAIETRGYERLPALRVAFAPVAANRRLFIGDEFAAGLLRQRQRLRELLNQCDWVATTYTVYGIGAEPSLAINRRQVLADITAIEALLARYANSPSSPLEAPPLSALQNGSPRLNVSVKDGEVMGGGGGDPFPFLDRATAVQTRTRLERVGLRAQARINQIRLDYRREPGTPGGSDQWQEVHGGEGGRDLGDLQLAPGVGIERIEAVTGARVDKLMLTTSDGQNLGGGGGAGNRPLDWRRPANVALLGFSGRSGGELDGLRAVLAEFGSLQWEPVLEGEDP